VKKIFRILIGTRLWINLGLIVAVISFLVAGTLFWLNGYTRHGEAVQVPDLAGYEIENLSDVLEQRHLTYEITDSIYSDEQPRGSVIQQNPLPGKTVKQDRTIYLTVNSILPETVIMHDLSGISRRIAFPMLEISGLELEQLTHKPDESCTGCVLDQLYKDNTIVPGTQIRKGEKITLVLGQRSDELTKVPRLLGLTFEDAYALLNAYSLNMGTVLSCEGCESEADTSKAFVINQLPAGHENAGMGSFVDLYLSNDSSKAAAFSRLNDTTNTDNPSPYDFQE
jgi:beta-lactam-binding protein with PASTA domain